MADDRPLYPIGIVSELLGVQPGTLRVWERSGIVVPSRRSGKRFYSEGDLKRLRFVQRLMAEGLNVPAIRHFLKFYLCWESTNCPSCMRCSTYVGCGRPCWKEEGAYCHVSANEETCGACKANGCMAHA